MSSRTCESCLRSRREISLGTKTRVYQAVLCSIMLYGRNMWTVRGVDEGVLIIFDNDNIHHTLNTRRKDCVLMVGLRRCLCLTYTHTGIVRPKKATLRDVLRYNRLGTFLHILPLGELQAR